MAFLFAELRNALVGRRLDVVVRPPARAGVRAGGPHLSRLVVGRRERRSRGCAFLSSYGACPSAGTTVGLAERTDDGAAGKSPGVAPGFGYSRTTRCLRSRRVFVAP